MNKHERYVEVCKQMDLLGIKDVSTPRQAKNGTVVWQLPIKNNWPGNQANASFIKVASFSTGYVRNQNSGYSNYQLNKRCESEPQYYPDHEWKTLGNGDYTQVKTGKYRKYTTRTCKLIPNEIDRLEYLIAYCLKNYYIKNANQVVNGSYVSKWYHEFELERLRNKHSDDMDARQLKYMDLGVARYDRIQDLEVEVELLQASVHALESQVNVADNKLSNAISPTKHECTKQYSVKLEEKLYNLQNKLATIERIANDTNEWNG